MIKMIQPANLYPSPQALCRVVLADDYELVREGLRALLEASGEVEVVGVATNGYEAIKLTRLLSPEIVITDLAMPELGGIEAISQIRLAFPQTRVIACSVHTSVAYVHGALRAGARGYLAKETVGVEIMTALHTVLANKYYLSPKIVEIVGELPADLAVLIRTLTMA